MNLKIIQSKFDPLENEITSLDARVKALERQIVDVANNRILR